MDQLFDEEYYKKYFHGYTIFDCAIHTKDIWFFLLVEEKEDRDVLPITRFVTVGSHLPIQNRFAGWETGEFTFASVACAYDEKKDPPREFLGVDFTGKVYSATRQRKGQEDSIQDVTDMTTAPGQLSVIQKVVTVAGQLYALGDCRKIYRRIGMDQWAELAEEGKGVPMPADAAQGKEYTFLDIGFCDMSGFSPNDMYAVGGSGDVWHFNGTKWVQCHFPTNELLKTVCCAGDGYVYITESHGSVWRGREDRWQKIAKADIASGYGPVDAVWFNNRLYLGAQEGIWVLDEKNNLVMLNEIEEGAPNMTNSGRLDVSPDGKFMLTAGPHGACIHDGEKWTRLFSSFDFLRDFSFLDPNFKQ